MTEPKKFPARPKPAVDVVTDWLEDGRYPPKRKVPGSYKASDAFACMRKVYYRRRPDEYPVDSDLPLGLFEQGNNTERSFVRALRREYGAGQVMGEVAENDRQAWVRVEIECGEETLEVRGFPDAVVLGYNNAAWALYEVKSKSKIWGNMKPGLNHVGQLATYWQALKPDYASLVYLGRNDLDTREFELPAPEAIWADVQAYFRRLYLFEVDDRVPPAVPGEGWECKFCDFKAQCQNDGGWEGSEKPWHRVEDPEWLEWLEWFE